MQPRICKYCDLVFIPKKHDGMRKYCYSLTCKEMDDIFKHKQLKLATVNSNHKRAIIFKISKKSIPKEELCTYCKFRRKMKGNRYLCELCFKVFANRTIDMDYGWGVDKFQKGGY